MTDIEPRQEETAKEVEDEDLEDVAGGIPYEYEPNPCFGPQGVSPD